MMRAPNALIAPQVNAATPVYYDENGVWQWGPYAVGGATRPDSFTGMDEGFRTALEQMFAAAPENIRDGLRVMSGYRSPERQDELWQEALAEYGDPEIADNWVAPPGRSFHNHGQAADLRYIDPEAEAWVRANAANFGLHFPMGHEPWHIEPIGARDGTSGRGGNNGWVAEPQMAQGPQSMPNALAPEDFAAMLEARQREMRMQQLNDLAAAFRPLEITPMRGA